MSVLILIIEELVPILALIVYLFVFVLTLKAEEIMPVFAIDSLLDCVQLLITLRREWTSLTVVPALQFWGALHLVAHMSYPTGE